MNTSASDPCFLQSTKFSTLFPILSTFSLNYFFNKSITESGVVQFTEIEPRPIGENFKTDIKGIGINDAPVTFIFNKIESLDAVIYQLQKLRDIMGE
ncbi:hypothetical protein [Psychrobacillus sp. NPDC093200]|uniref:hypothetical protein n=1 Tax=Psychrobacillus sp. NPDC093200 TaxID=3390656 RepID=UPI003D070FAB